MSVSSIKIKTQTWNYDNQGLFDYSSKDIHKNAFSVDTNSTIFICREFCYIPDKNLVPGSVALLNVTRFNSSCQLSINLSSSIWKVVRHSKQKKHYFSEGDWIKLGKTKMLVKQINLNNSSSQDLLSSFYKEKAEKDCDQPSQEEVCRICLASTCSSADPLISPCKCSGSVSLIHVSCLKYWLKSKVNSKCSSKVLSFYSTDLNCELCKEDIPPVVKYQGNSFMLVDVINHNTSPNILLEEFSVNGSAKIGMHLVSLKESQTVTIGRSQEAELKIDEITVSRKHCKIALDREGFCVNDLDSKFGTLIKLHRNVIVKQDSEVFLQIGRTTLQVTIKGRRSLCCRNKEKKNEARKCLKTQPENLENQAEFSAFIVNQD